MYCIVLYCILFSNIICTFNLQLSSKVGHQHILAECARAQVSYFKLHNPLQEVDYKQKLINMYAKTIDCIFGAPLNGAALSGAAIIKWCST